VNLDLIVRKLLHIRDSVKLPLKKSFFNFKKVQEPSKEENLSYNSFIKSLEENINDYFKRNFLTPRNTTLGKINTESGHLILKINSQHFNLSEGNFSHCISYFINVISSQILDILRAVEAVFINKFNLIIWFHPRSIVVDNIPNTIELIDADGNINYDRITSFSAADYAFIFSYARKLAVPGLTIGGNAKVIYRKVGDFASAWGFGLDAAHVN
jgi:hypothetical protein